VHDAEREGPWVLFESALVLLGEFRCPPDSPRWRETNSIGAGHHVVFPAAPVEIAQGGRPAFVTNRNHVVLYNPEQEYRRALVSPAGDECFYLVVAPEVVEASVHDASFPVDHGSVGPATFLTQRRLRQLARREEPEVLDVEEEALAVVDGALRDALPAAPAAAVGDLRVEHVKALLSERFDERLTLSEVGRAVGCSPWHLARTFRRLTGTSIHAYLRQLRVRYAVDQLLEGCADLASLAVSAGFASHSHLTDSFRAVFGVSPSQVRQRLQSR
jgi:AraC-like DNA-binding protein